eukprot:s5314_g4.t2
MANRMRHFLWCLLLPLHHGGQVLSPLPVRVLPYDQCERPTGSRMVHFARHGQAEHNVALAQGRAGPQHVDSRLTKCGEEQAAGIARTLEKDVDWPDIVLTSPLRRCLRTALLAFRPKVGCVLALEELRELVSASPHNSRRPVEELKMEFPQVDFSRISTSHDGIWRQDMDRESRQYFARRTLDDSLSARPGTLLANAAAFRHLASLGDEICPPPCPSAPQTPVSPRRVKHYLDLLDDGFPSPLRPRDDSPYTRRYKRPSSHSDCPAKQTLVEDPAPEQRKPPLPCGQASASPAESGLLDAEIVGGNLPEVPSPAFSFSDREWMNYQQQRQRLEEADVVEAALVQHGRKLARQKPLCGTTKWGGRRGGSQRVTFLRDIIAGRQPWPENVPRVDPSLQTEEASEPGAHTEAEEGEPSSSSSRSRFDRSRSPQLARPPIPPQPLRPTFAAVPEEIRFFRFCSTSGLWEEQSRVERYGRPTGQHLALDINQVLNRGRRGVIQQGHSLPSENLDLLVRIVAEFPGDSILLCSQLENPSLLRGLLDTLGCSRGANHLLPFIAITPRKVGPLGKARLLATLSNSRDWLLVDDNNDTIDEHVRLGGSGIHIALPRRPWCQESVVWQCCFADCFDSIAASKRNNDFL